jgi:hypothetical protein
METLSLEQRNKIITEILLGKKVLDINEEIIILVQPSGEQKAFANYLEDKTTLTLLSQGFFSESAIPPKILRTVFSLNDEEDLKSNISKKKTYETILSKRIPNTKLFKEDQKKLNDINKRISDLSSKKESANQFSAEFSAREEKNIYLLSQCVMTAENKLKWNSVEDLLNISYSDLYNYMIIFFEFLQGFDSKTLRSVARCNEWRALFLSAQKLGTKLFERPASDFSIPQIHLVSWSFYYDNIYEMPLHERPEEDVIEDDEQLDLFLQNYIKNLKAEVASIPQSSSKKLSDSQDQQIVTTSDKRYLKLHKNGQYSDPVLIKSRSGNN